MNSLYEQLSTDYDSYDDSYDDSLDDSFDERRRGGRRRPTSVRANTGSGVSGGTVNTPSGSAQVQLPEKVVSQDAFEKAIAQLQGAINNNAKALGDLGAEHSRTRGMIAKMKKEMRDQAMMNSLFSYMQMNKMVTDINAHTHGTSADAIPEAKKVTTNMMMALMPMFMGSSDSGDGDNSNMMMMMLLMMK